MRLASRTVKDGLYWGAVSGVTAWTIYAIVECLFSSILPYIIKPSYEYVPVHPGFTALLFGIYPIIGSVLGGLAGVCLLGAKRRFIFVQKIKPSNFFPAFATFSVVFVYVINFIINYFGSVGLSKWPILFIYLLLIFALLLSIKSNAWFSRLRFLANPWTASIVLIGLPWINSETLSDSSLVLKAVTVLIYPSAIFMISFFIQKIGQRSRLKESMASIPAVSIRPLLSLVPVVLMVFGASFFLKQAPLVVPQKLASPKVVANRPNVLLIVMDTVRADHCSLYGYERDTTPNLRKFAQEATLYTKAIASGEVTLSTHGSIFTGLYAKQHRAHFDLPDYPHGRPLAERFETLAEYLSYKGFLTFGIVANRPFLSTDYKLNQGFQFWDNRDPVLFFGKVRSYFIRQSIRNILTIFASPSDFDQTFRKAEDINREVFSCFDELKQTEKPWLIFINYMDAHDPYLPPAPFDRIFPGKAEYFSLANYRKIGKEINKLEHKLSVIEYNHLLSQYDGAITYIDFQIESLIFKLRELDFYENTLIIITSDHGEVFGRRGFMYHGVSVYQDQVHIPLIIKYPNIKKQYIVNEVASTVDLMPTIIDVLRYEIPNNISGQSLLKLKRGQQRPIFSESFPIDRLVSFHPRFRRTEIAAFLGNFKLISSTTMKRELYNLSKDPNEKKNLYDSDNDVSKELETKLNNWLASVELADKEADTPVQLDKDTIDALKTLGYAK